MAENSYKAFFDADLTKLPTEVLSEIGKIVRKELDKRRLAKIQDSKSHSANESKTIKLFKQAIKGQNIIHWMDCLDYLIDQDWSSLFDGDSEKKYYVYFHITPNTKSLIKQTGSIKIHTNGLPFYVGKGTGSRAYDLNRNQGHGVILRQLKEANHSEKEIVYIVKTGMSEPEALELESKLIYFFGTRYEKGRKGLLVNLDIPKRIELS